MSGPAWIVDPKRIACKIISASAPYGKVEWKSNPSKSCPKCSYVMDNTDVAQAWPGLPRGVKFDPSDQEIVWHLLAKSGDKDFKPHPFIDEFIPTVDEDDGICYTHPQNLPGVKQDGSMSHFFHRAIKAYNTGTRKRRKIHGDDSGDVRWHKTGRTKPVLVEGVQRGCKKIMVLYVSSVRGGKAEKTNWVMHQYHLGTEEDEKEGEYVLSKVFYQQQQQTKTNEMSKDDNPELFHITSAKVDPVTPKSVDPEPRAERTLSDFEPLRESTFLDVEHLNEGMKEDAMETPSEQYNNQDQINMENDLEPVGDNNENEAGEDLEELWLLNSQQHVEGLSLCDDLLQSQSPDRIDCGNPQGPNDKPRLADYLVLGPEEMKKDLEECQKLRSDDLANIDFDVSQEFRLSQLEFGSQDSYVAWGGSCQGGRVVDDV